jgi:hypothetical protein
MRRLTKAGCLLKDGNFLGGLVSARARSRCFLGEYGEGVDGVGVCLF